MAAGEIKETDYDAAIAAFRAWSTRPDAALWYAINWAEGVKPE